MHNYLLQFTTVAVAHLLAVMSPGPDFAVVTKNSLSHSRKAGIYTALGIALGLSVHVTYSLLGIGFIISRSIILFNIIKLIGAGYLIYIGYKAVQSKPVSVLTEAEHISVPASMKPGQAIKNGFLVNVLNQKATLFVLALFTQVIDPLTPTVIKLGYGIEMMIATFVWFSIVAILFSHGTLRAKIQKAQHWIDRTTGVVLIALGLKVALSHR